MESSLAASDLLVPILCKKRSSGSLPLAVPSWRSIDFRCQSYSPEVFLISLRQEFNRQLNLNGSGSFSLIVLDS